MLLFFFLILYRFGRCLMFCRCEVLSVSVLVLFCLMWWLKMILCRLLVLVLKLVCWVVWVWLLRVCFMVF